MKNPLKRKKKPKTEQTLLLPDAIKKLVTLEVATVKDGKYVYSKSFEDTIAHMKKHGVSRIKQLKYGQQAGRKMIPQLLASVATNPSRKDMENLINSYVCLKIHFKRTKKKVNKNFLPDLAYGLWYLNDNEPTIKEVEEWNLT